MRSIITFSVYKILSHLKAQNYSVRLFLGSKQEFYINGRLVAKDTTKSFVSASRTAYSSLVLGAGHSYGFIGDYWNMHIDDFAIWKGHYFTPDDVIYIMNKGN